MNRKRAKRVVKKIAKQRGITENEVISEIEYAIMDAYQRKEALADKNGTSLWNEIPHVGEIPTAYELIAYLSEKLLENEK